METRPPYLVAVACPSPPDPDQVRKSTSRERGAAGGGTGGQ